MARARRRRSKNILAGPKWSGVDTVMTIGAIGVLGFAGYFMLKSGKGVEESLQTAGDWGKNLTDAINSSGSWIGGGSKFLQDWSYNLQKTVGGSVGGVGKTITEGLGGIGAGASGAGERLGNAGCWIQKAFNPGLNCTDLNQKDIVVIKYMLTNSPKSAPRITNNVAQAMMRMGIAPSPYTF